MRVEKSSDGSFPRKSSVKSTQGSQSSGNVESTPDSTANPARQPAAEVSQLLAQLQEISEIRPEIVADIKRRIEKGELLSQEDAEATAEAVLADVSEFYASDPQDD